MATRRRPSRHPADHALWDQRALTWERWEPVLMNGLAAVNPVLLRALDLAPGQRILDLGCGSGEPALALAQWVAPRGRVVGIDDSTAMLAVAQRRARILRLTNVTFRHGDMNRLALRRAGFHRVAARYSLMFAADPEAVLRSLRASLAPGGILAAAVWGPTEGNPTARIRDEVARPFLKEPPPDPADGPNPMRFARRGALAALLRRTGFRNVRSEPVPVATVYPRAEDFAEIQLGSALAETYAALGAADQRRLAARLVSRVRRFQDGPVLRVPGHAWVVSGRR